MAGPGEEVRHPERSESQMEPWAEAGGSKVGGIATSSHSQNTFF
jgi:hypothetical protein